MRLLLSPPFTEELQGINGKARVSSRLAVWISELAYQQDESVSMFSEHGDGGPGGVG